MVVYPNDVHKVSRLWSLTGKKGQLEKEILSVAIFVNII